MPAVATLPDLLRTALAARDVIVFDGVCVLCSGFFRFVLRYDRTKRFSFATAQSPLGQALYQALDLPTDDFETNLVIVDGVVHQRLSAFCVTMRVLGWPWRALTVLGWLPESAQDWLYLRIARNRYGVFGRRETCLVPPFELRERFLNGPLIA